MTLLEFLKKHGEKILEVYYQIKNSDIMLDPFNIAKHCGIDISFLPLNMYAYTARNPVTNQPEMYISESVDRYSQKILCYHELGHILCDGKASTYLFDHTIDQEAEFIANCFMLLFMPQVLSRQKINENTRIEAINEYISCQIHMKSSTPVMPGQLSLFDVISLDDEYWKELALSHTYKKNL